MKIIWPWNKIPAPSFLPSRMFPNGPEKEFTWEDFEENAKKEYPIRYWWQYTASRKWDRWVTGFNAPIPQAWYFIRTHTYNRYHIVNLKCPTWGLEYNWGWIDRSEAILIASFQLLKEFMEKEYPHGLCDWQAEENHSNANREMQELYHWWVTGRKKSWDNHWEKSKVFGDPLRIPYKVQNSEEYRKHMDEYCFLEKQDDVMLERLMKIRGYLWT